MKLRTYAKILLFNTLFLLGLLELAGLAGYYQRTGKIYYLDPPGGRAVPRSFEGTVEGYRLHPYLGFVIQPGAPAPPSLEAAPTGANPVTRHNNYGFLSLHDYPRPRRDPRELLVGIFGGSAAAYLAVFEAEHGILAAELARASGREPERVTVLNFAQGGFKQPQQQQILAYFLALGQELDVVINFDGFNDMVLSGRNLEHGFAADMPSYEHLGALREITSLRDSVESLEQMLAIRASWAGYSHWYNRAWSGEAWETRAAAGFFVDWLIYKLHHRQYTRSRLALAPPAHGGSGESWLHLRPDPPLREPDDAEIRSLADLWQRSSVAMARLAEIQGTRFLAFVQPNQYFPTERSFTPEEAKVAFSPLTPYRQHVERGYPVLLAAAESLREDGLFAESLTHLLDAEPEPVYIDDCCHFTHRGQTLILEHIARRIAERLPVETE